MTRKSLTNILRYPTSKSGRSTNNTPYRKINTVGADAEDE
jgi:hypothetical protein